MLNEIDTGLDPTASNKGITASSKKLLVADYIVSHLANRSAQSPDIFVLQVL